MSILFITHDLGVVAEMADRVVVMYAGRVVEEGDVRDIFARPRMPYTRALMRSIPRLDRTRWSSASAWRRIAGIRAEPPAPAARAARSIRAAASCVTECLAIGAAA